MSPFAHITGWGMSVPDHIVTNKDLEQIVDTTDEWIQSRTGIRERRLAADGQTSASLAVEAAQEALKVAKLNPADLDLIIVSTSSPEYIFPATACLVQDRLGAVKAGAFDLSAACTGFIYAMTIASQAIKSGTSKNALVIGSETLSRFVDWKDRDTCILFGDGAGAFVLQAGEEQAGILSSVMRSDGSGGDLLSVPGGGSRHPATMETLEKGLHFIHMSGREVFRFATRVMVQATEEAVGKAGMKLEDINWVIPHQANLRIIEAAMRGLKLPMERSVVNLERFGNTSTASIPIATCEAVQDGRVKPGDRIVFVGFGAGLTWGAVTLIWSGPFAGAKRMLPVRFRLYARFRSWVNRMIRRLDALIWGRHNPYI